MERSFRLIFPSIAIIGTITWLAIFEYNYHRGQTTRFIEEHGGKVTGNVRRNTEFLLVGENPGGAKYSGAQELGIPMIDEEGLRRMVQR